MGFASPTSWVEFHFLYTLEYTVETIEWWFIVQTKAHFITQGTFYGMFNILAKLEIAF